MPELPEVETVRQGLRPAMEGARFERVTLNRPNLRYPFPDHFAARLVGATIQRIERRAKYLVADLSTQESLIMHLGMSGRFDVEDVRLGQYVHHVPSVGHLHVVFEMAFPEGHTTRVTYADPRRFGFMDLVATEDVEACRHFSAMGPEPLGDDFTAKYLVQRFSGRSAPLKAALLDQRVVAGLGNIYVCEALWRSRLSPRRQAKTIGPVRAERLVGHIRQILQEAIAAGGSSLKDYRATDGAMGLFQHDFDVYDREGEDCRHCGGMIRRINQSGRSTFFCGQCQR